MSPPFIADCDIIWYGISLSSAGSAVPAVSPSQLLVPPQHPKTPWHCASTAEQWLKHRCVTNTIFSQIWNTGPHKLLQRKVTLSQPCPIHILFATTKSNTRIGVTQTVALHLIREYFLGFFKPTEMQKIGFFLFPSSFGHAFQKQQKHLQDTCWRVGSRICFKIGKSPATGVQCCSFAIKNW